MRKYGKRIHKKQVLVYQEIIQVTQCSYSKKLLKKSFINLIERDKEVVGQILNIPHNKKNLEYDKMEFICMKMIKQDGKITKEMYKENEHIREDVRDRFKEYVITKQYTALMQEMAYLNYFYENEFENV